jgi:hypothetical protein
MANANAALTMCPRCWSQPAANPGDLCRDCVETIASWNREPVLVTVMIPNGIDRAAMLTAIRNAIESATPCIVKTL